MPNHVHGIIVINHTGTARIADKKRRVPTGQFGKPISGALSTIIGSFKSAVTKRINKLRRKITPPIWQRSFYDHIIRTDISLQKIRDYIINNPANWATDEYNLNNGGIVVQARLNPTGNVIDS
jgi:REP element-mobilizing transposase RayT